MSTEFFVDLENISKFAITEHDIADADYFNRLQIGTCYGTCERTHLLDEINRELNTSKDLDHVIRLEMTKNVLLFGTSRYATQQPDGQIEFFEKELRFCWYIPSEFLIGKGEPTQPEDIHNLMLDYWNYKLCDNTHIITLGCNYNINTWHDMKETIFGIDNIMEPSAYSVMTNRIKIPSTPN